MYNNLATVKVENVVNERKLIEIREEQPQPKSFKKKTRRSILGSVGTERPEKDLRLT